jgi:serine/threonine protein kinase
MIDQHLREGDRLARRYVLDEPIGTGGMSVIWRAWDEALQRTVAVKVLDGPIGTSDGHREMIRREARAAARIEHPNAIQVYDYGETITPRGRVAAYAVMQLLDGTSLAERLAAGPLPWREAVPMAATVADVLAAAHRKNVVHRDVTPENVMLTSDGVKLLDFGIAAEFGQREEGLTFGTPPYVAPERLADGQSTGAADVYALGVLLFESLTGATPFGATTWDELEFTERRVIPPLDVPGLPQPVAAICRRCLAVDPADRPRAIEVAEVLRSVAPAAPGRRRIWIPVAVVVAVVAVAVAVILGTRTDPPPAAVGGPSVIAESAVPLPPPPATPETSAAPRSLTPSPTPSAKPSPLSVDDAANVLFTSLDKLVASGDMRDDVALDLRHHIDDLVAHPADPQARLDRLHQSLRSRQRENGMSSAAVAELDAKLNQFGAALAAAS